MFVDVTKFIYKLYYCDKLILPLFSAKCFKFILQKLCFAAFLP